MLPKDLIKIIIDYKNDLEYHFLIKKHKEKFNKTLSIIKRIRNSNVKINKKHLNKSRAAAKKF